MRSRPDISKPPFQYTSACSTARTGDYHPLEGGTARTFPRYLDLVRIFSTALAILAFAVPAAALGSGQSSGTTSRSTALVAAVVRDVNHLRVERGLRPLTVSSELRQAADTHSQDILEAGVFSHDSPDGTLVLGAPAAVLPTALGRLDGRREPPHGRPRRAELGGRRGCLDELAGTPGEPPQPPLARARHRRALLGVRGRRLRRPADVGRHARLRRPPLIAVGFPTGSVGRTGGPHDEAASQRMSDRTLRPGGGLRRRRMGERRWSPSATRMGELAWPGSA